MLICLFLDESKSHLWRKEANWLSHVEEYLVDARKDVLDLSWGSFHANREKLADFPCAINSLLPLFREHSTSAAMMKHGMDLIHRITAHLNKNQIPVLCVDQPLFKLAKCIQWNSPDLYGENKLVVLFGPFHIEQNFLHVLGQLLEESGWSRIVENSHIYSEARANSILKVRI